LKKEINNDQLRKNPYYYKLLANYGIVLAKKKENVRAHYYLERADQWAQKHFIEDVALLDGFSKICKSLGYNEKAFKLAIRALKISPSKENAKKFFQ